MFCIGEKCHREYLDCRSSSRSLFSPPPPPAQNVSSGDSVTECALHHGSGGLSAANQFLRAELGVCLVAVFLILLAAGFSAYSLRHPRYTYKRIAGALHLFVAAVLIALMEMVRSEAHLDVHQVT